VYPASLLLRAAYQAGDFVLRCPLLFGNGLGTTTLKTSSLPREFVFNGSRIPDPDPQMSIDQVRDLLTPSYPEIRNLSICSYQKSPFSMLYEILPYAATHG